MQLVPCQLVLVGRTRQQYIGLVKCSLLAEYPMLCIRPNPDTKFYNQSRTEQKNRIPEDTYVHTTLHRHFIFLQSVYYSLLLSHSPRSLLTSLNLSSTSR